MLSQSKLSGTLPLSFPSLSCFVYLQFSSVTSVVLHTSFRICCLVRFFHASPPGHSISLNLILDCVSIIKRELLLQLCFNLRLHFATVMSEGVSWFGWLRFPIVHSSARIWNWARKRVGSSRVTPPSGDDTMRVIRVRHWIRGRAGSSRVTLLPPSDGAGTVQTSETCHRIRTGADFNRIPLLPQCDSAGNIRMIGVRH